MNVTEVRNVFEEEFKNLQHKFVIFDLTIPEAEISQDEYIWKPGVYIYWHTERGIIKVGRHFTNSRKRALEHIKHNTGGTMASLRDDSKSRLLLFNIKNLNDIHWVAALEVYLEKKIAPEIRSGRLG
ncbi:hypothetical protein [Desulfonatronum thiosulfatophilum]|uniref:hypothetical protein n=1 Tax=Desulfonatronum thiosulfatophilum TaxID=617002 RepID=UPI000B877349|nr:hypothetical protein [Desulfonatronum thiosulfatophilum]